MPFYEYQCSDCGHYEEALQKISDPPLRECPGCKHESLTRLMSAPAFRLKGGGWYETDFKSGGDTKRNLAESGGGSSEGATSTKESAKPAEAKESKSEAAKPAASESKPAAKPAETKSATTV